MIHSPRLGGRTYLFGFFEGFRYPQSATIGRAVPSPSLMAGTIYAANASGTMVPYNLKSIDPRGIGLNPDVEAMWSKYEPKGTISGSPGAALCGPLTNTVCDGYNAVAFLANMSEPLTSNDMAFRVDHAFSSKWNWFASYRYYKLTQAWPAAGRYRRVLPGRQAGRASGTGEPAAAAMVSGDGPDDQHHDATRPTISTTASCATSGSGATTTRRRRFPDWAGAMEPIGENATYALTPFNVNTQSIRTRFWDGQDNFFSDNLSLLKGNHLIQFGGQYPAQLRLSPAQRQRWRHQLHADVPAGRRGGLGSGGYVRSAADTRSNNTTARMAAALWAS